jgi:hypothetical protein
MPCLAGWLAGWLVGWLAGWLAGRLGKQTLSLFTVIPLILLISGRAWEAYFVAIYGDPAHFADLRASLGSIFCRYLR